MLQKIAVFSLFAGLVYAKGKDPVSSSYTLTLNGQTYTGEFDVKKLPCTGTVTLRGQNNGYDIDCATMGVHDYHFTGNPNAERMFTSKTVIYKSKELTLTPQQLGTPRVDRLRMKQGELVLEFAIAAGKVKFQSKDNAAGGIMQTETEITGNVTHTHTLADGIFYFLDPNLGNAVRIGNGVAPDSTHQVFVGKDSPQGANRLYQDGRVSSWNVWSGGRMGAVFGEDALEQAPGAGDCTENCQAQNQIRGSLPVTSLPDNIVPIGAGGED